MLLKEIAWFFSLHFAVFGLSDRRLEMILDIQQVKRYFIQINFNYIIMELSVDQKIQAAVQPLLDRIAALEADNQLFKQEIAALQVATQPKPVNKPGPKPPIDHLDRPQTVKGNRKSIQHHDTKPEPRAINKPGPKKQEPKGQQQDNKNEINKVIGGKTPTAGNKVVPSPTVNKDTNVTKPKPNPGVASRPNLGVPGTKGGATDKKPIGPKSNDAEHEKKQEGQQKIEDKKSHTSQEKEHKTASVHNLKSPVATKPKANQKPADKKPIGPATVASGVKKPVPNKPEPKPQQPIKGGKKPLKTDQPQVKEQIKAEAPQVQGQVTDEVKVELQAQLNSQEHKEVQEANNVEQKKEQPHPQQAAADIEASHQQQVKVEEAPKPEGEQGKEQQLLQEEEAL